MRQRIAQDVENGKLNVEDCRGLQEEHWSLAATLAAVLAIAAVLAAVVAVPVVRWVALFCLLCYPLPFLPTHLIVKKKVADPQFRSSFNFGVRLALSIIYAVVIGIVMACCGGAWMNRLADIGAWWGLVAVAWVFVGARLAAPTVCFLRSTADNCRYWLRRLVGSRRRG